MLDFVVSRLIFGSKLCDLVAFLMFTLILELMGCFVDVVWVDLNVTPPMISPLPFPLRREGKERKIRSLLLGLT